MGEALVPVASVDPLVGVEVPVGPRPQLRDVLEPVVVAELLDAVPRQVVQPTVWGDDCDSVDVEFAPPLGNLVRVACLNRLSGTNPPDQFTVDDDVGRNLVSIVERGLGPDVVAFTVPVPLAGIPRVFDDTTRAAHHREFGLRHCQTQPLCDSLKPSKLALDNGAGKTNA